MKVVECPRDAMQGLQSFVPTELKVKYINQLLKVGFDTIDVGSFVSPKAVPQMKDTRQVLENLHLHKTKSKLLAIVANTKGAMEACQWSVIDYLGFPLSLSETFQRRNTNKSISEAFEQLKIIQQVCQDRGKTLVVYLSMGFGNPYGDPYEETYVAAFVAKLQALSVQIVSLADTTGVSSASRIKSLFQSITRDFPQIEFGVHLHADRDTAVEKINAACQAGCRRFDGAMNGFGGCPMAGDKLVGNIATESILKYFEDHYIYLPYDRKAFSRALNIAAEVFLGH